MVEALQWRAMERDKSVHKLIWPAIFLAGLNLFSVLFEGAASAEPQPPLDIAVTKMSLEELLDIDVTSVSKRPQRLFGAAAAVSVLTGEDIRRSGATSVPEALRLAPGVEVARIDANKWAVSIRGFNSRTAQKLLVLIDGRSVYNQLYSGVFWEVQDVLLEDVDRIEIIRGPGGTLWGANAVNGVINIITKSAKDTQGTLLVGGGGTEERLFGHAEQGTKLGKDGYVRAFGKYFQRDDQYSKEGSDDDWWFGRGGFRADWEKGDATNLTLQGAGYRSEASQRYLQGYENVQLSGAHLLSRWGQADRAGDSQLQGYYDLTNYDSDALKEERHTVDFDFQRHLAALPSQDLVWGLRYRLTWDDIQNSDFLGVDPTSRTDNLASVFVQDEFHIVPDRVQLVLGTKLDFNDYTGLEYQPNIRLAYTPTARQTFWTAISRAVRTPSRLEDDIVFATLHGNKRFDSEELIAYEAGYRVQPMDELTLDIATFYNDYDRLLSVEDQLVSNTMEGQTFGAEVGLRWQALSWVRLDAAYTSLHLNLSVPDDSDFRTSAERIERSDPKNIFSLRAAMNLSETLEFDTGLRYSDSLPGTGVDSYTVADLRLGWRATRSLMLDLVGQNLFNEHHAEQGGSLATEVEQGVYAKATLTF